MHRWPTPSKLKVFLTLTTLICSQLIQNINAESTDVEQERSGTLQLSGSSTSNTYVYSALLILPVLAIIILLDFAIFGTFARRADELNPVSNFFYHVRRGLHISQNKYRRRYGVDRFYDRYRSRWSLANHRNARSELKQIPANQRNWSFIRKQQYCFSIHFLYSIMET